MSKTDYWKFILALILGTLTLIAYQYIDKYTISDETLLVNGLFDAGLSGWSLDKSDRELVSVSDGEIHIHSADAAQSPRLWQNVDLSRVDQLVHLSAWVKAEQIVAGEKPWDMGRIIFLQLRDEKPDYSIPHVLIALDGTGGWQYYDSVFPIHSESEGALVMIQMNNSSGILSCKNMTLAKASLNPYFEIARSVVLACWICLFATIFYPLFVKNREGVTGRVIILFLLGAIVAGTMLPGGIKNSMKSQIEHEGTAMVRKVIDGSTSGIEPEPLDHKTDHEWTIDITKLAHFFLFSTLTLTLLWSSTSENIWYVILAVIILACGTELVQLFVEGRGALTTDVVLDWTGCTVGALIWLLFRKNDRFKS